MTMPTPGGDFNRVSVGGSRNRSRGRPPIIRETTLRTIIFRVPEAINMAPSIACLRVVTTRSDTSQKWLRWRRCIKPCRQNPSADNYELIRGDQPVTSPRLKIINRRLIVRPEDRYEWHTSLMSVARFMKLTKILLLTDTNGLFCCFLFYISCDHL